MKVKEYLKQVKANRYTYYNLDKETIKQFKNLYKYLKKHKNKETFNLLFGLISQLDKYQIKPFDSDYLKKYKRMQVISRTIKH